MTALVYPSARYESMTATEHRQGSVGWARRALLPGAAVILGMETTTPGGGAFAGKGGYSNLRNGRRPRKAKLATPARN